MLSRMDHDQILMDAFKFNLMKHSECVAKPKINCPRTMDSLQIRQFLGKSTQLPDSLSSDDSAAAHSLANGTDLDSHAFPRDAEQKDTGSTGIHSCGKL